MIVRAAAIAFMSTSAIVATPAVAQSTPAVPVPAPADSQADRGDDIIVTANKREERISDVALSITAVSGAELTARRLIDIQDLSTRVPGLNFTRGGANGPGQRLIVRGLNTNSPNGTVASVFDDVPLTASAAAGIGGDFAADFDPFDLQRVEVLKGPQGTLYGAASLGGLVKYVSQAPNLTAIKSGYDVGFSTLRHGSAGAFGKAYVNVPLVNDVAAIRASGYYEYSPGWIGNALGANPATNTVRRYGGRVALLVRPTENLTLRANALVQNREAGGYDTVEVKGYLDPADPFGLLAGYNKNTYLDEPSNSHSEIYSFHADYDLGGVTLQSITSYGKIRTSYMFDSPFYVPLSAAFFGRANTTLTSRSVNSLKKFNQELRLSSDNGAAASGHGLEYQFGAFYTRETTEYTDDYLTRDATTRGTVITPASVFATPPGTPQVFLTTISSKYREYAGYADLTYHFSPRFDIEVGGRIFRNEQSFTQLTGGAFFSPATFTTSGPFSSSETRATFAVAPRFHVTPNIILYARAASGYRPGGPNLLVPPAGPAPDTPGTPQTTFGADTTVNYEAGIKGGLLGNRVNFDIAAYYIDWSAIQISTVYARGFTAYPVTINAGKAVSKGVEWNLNVRPMRALTIGWLGAYDKATLSGAIPEIAGTAGSQLPYVPKFTSTVTVDLEVPLSPSVTGAIGGAYSYTGKRFSNYNFDPSRSYRALPSYSLWSAQVGITVDRFTIQAYGKNLTDKRAVTNYDPGSVIFGVPFPGTAGLIRPRELGLRLAANF